MDTIKPAAYLENFDVAPQAQPTGYDDIPVAIYTCDNLGHVTSFNKAAVQLWGRTPELGKDIWCGSWKIFYPSGAPMPLDICPMAIALKEARSVDGEEIVVERPDGTRRNVLPHPTPLFGRDGGLTGAVNTLVDITEQKSRQTKDAMLAAIITSSEDAIISKNLNGIITTWNVAAERMYGYTEKEAIGRHITTIIPPDRIDEETLIISKIKSGENIEHFETERVGKDGAVIPVSLTISPIKDINGNIIGASKIARDISKQKLAENKLQQYADDLEKLYEQVKKLNAKKDEFIGLASHELKTPVTSLKGYLQMFEKNLPDTDKNKVYINKAVRQINKLSGLISDLLDVSKIETGKLPLDFSAFNLKTLIKEVVELMQYSAKSHQIILHAEDEPVTVNADRQRIEQVITNLVSNAIKYSPGANRVDIFLNKNGNNAHIEVRDSGIGISEEQQDRVFSRFYRVSDVAAHISGLGIGLYISKEITNRHNGKLEVKSKLGKGSTFVFELPLADS